MFAVEIQVLRKGEFGDDYCEPLGYMEGFISEEFDSLNQLEAWIRERYGDDAVVQTYIKALHETAGNWTEDWQS